MLHRSNKMCFQSPSDWSIKGTNVSEVSLTLTARPTAFLATLTWRRWKACAPHRSQGNHIKAAIAWKPLRQVEADFTVIPIQAGGQLRDWTVCLSPGLFTMSSWLPNHGVLWELELPDLQIFAEAKPPI